MTLGEKIKFFREQLGMTQNTLASLTGIHPVSIRKYETNRMQPQSTQIEKISSALGISYNALNGIENGILKLETFGDLMGLIILLYKSNIIQITGKRDKNDIYKKDTVKISINPILSSFLDFEKDNDSIPLNDLILNIKNDKICDDFVKWEAINYIYEHLKNEYKSKSTDKLNQTLSKIEHDKEIIELELQKSQILLDKRNGLEVKIIDGTNNL